MRRKDREVTDLNQLREIIKSCKTCHLGMVDGKKPYVVPLSFGYELDEGRLTLYFHSARQGRKIDILRENDAVCFEMCLEGESILDEADPCESGYYYSSVIGFGSARFVESPDEKCDALSLLMKHQAGVDVRFTHKQAESVCVFKVTADNFTGKMKAHT